MKLHSGKKKLWMVVVQSRYESPEVGMILADHEPTDEEAVRALDFTVADDDQVWVFEANPKPAVEI